MKKIITLIAGLACITSAFSQQTFTNFENASMVIGQPNFQSLLTNISDSVTRGPAYCAISSKGMLAVAEQSGYSVKIWHNLPTRNGQPSDVQISLPFFAEGVDWSPDGNKLIVAGGNSYIYIWNSIPVVNNQPVDVTVRIYTNSPQGVLVTPNGKLLISERYNHRILVWNSIPVINDTPADYVIGQPDMTTTSTGTSAGKLNQPWGLDLSPDGKLLIADEQNHRVVIYDSVPVASGENATVVIGQTAFGQRIAGISDFRISTPVGVTATVDGKIAVSEFGNHRVTIWDSIPQTNGEAATVVLGQPDFYTGTPFYPSGTPDTNNMRNLYTISSDLNGRLFLCGRDMHRVMVFGDLPTDSADLSVSIKESSAFLCDSSDVVYSFIINNPGPDTAKSVVATTAFPSGYSVDNVTIPDGSYNLASGYWSIPCIAPNDSAQLIINGLVQAGMAGLTITTYANIINSSAIDTNLNDNGTNVSVTILTIAKPDDPIAFDTETCFGSSASLSASGSGTLYWYSDVDDVTPLDTGNTYLTVPLTTAGTFYVEANNGCPSNNRVAIDVSLNPVYNESETDAICSGESYTFPDGTTQNNITSTVVHTSNLITVNGCDSVITTTINVNPVYNLAESAGVCSGDSYTFPDGTTQNNITSTVVHASNFVTVEGCDSIITTTVDVNPVYDLAESAGVCSGDSYTFPDGTTQNNITSTVVHASNLVTVEGCDSVITTTVNVNPVYDLAESAGVCSGDSYTFPDGTTQNNITSTVVHASNLVTVNGCDSVITTTVNVNPVYDLAESAGVCSG
ncbi:MAG: hypothetical protein JXB24_01805, partial [Bacteroidales bacterium]|nr:hypothetical protein [Bacteroidales bacterium]